MALSVGTLMAAGADPDETEFQLRALITQIRLLEGGPIVMAELATDDDELPKVEPESLAPLGLMARDIALQSKTPLVKEQAAALWLLAGAPDSEEPIDGLAELLPEAESRSAVSDVLLLAAAGQPVPTQTAEALAGLAINPWLRGRLQPFATAPGEPLDPNGEYADGERPFVKRAFAVLGFFSMATLAGIALLLFLSGRAALIGAGAKWRPLPRGLAHEKSLSWGNEPWVPWFVVCMWFAAMFTLGLAGSLALVDVTDGAARALYGLATQVLAGLVAVHVLAALQGGTWRTVLSDLKIGLQPWNGKLTWPILWGLGAWLCALPIVYGSGIFQQAFGLESETITNPILPELVSGGFAKQLILVVSAVAGAAIFEELVFRGVLYRGLRLHLGPVGAAVLSSLVFAAIHPSLSTILPLFVLALVLCWVTERSGGLLPAMLVHGLWNGGSLLLTTVVFGG